MTTTTQTIVREHEADLVVREAATVAEDVVALTLAAADGSPLPAWTPGAHIDLVLDDTLTRQYSLCGSPFDSGVWRVGVLRTPDSRGGSTRVHQALQPGASVRVRGPRNHFPLASSASYLFIAGGIGITPMLPMIAEAEATGRLPRRGFSGLSSTLHAYLVCRSRTGQARVFRALVDAAR